MKTTSTLVMLAAALALAGCDQNQRSYTRTNNDDGETPEVRKEAREGLNAPDKDIARGQDISQPGVTDQNVPPPVVTPDLQRDLNAIADSVKSDNNRDQFVLDTEKKLSDLNDSITSLGEKVESLNTDAYAKDVISGLREKHEQVEMKFFELKAASRESWMEFKPAFDTAFDELNRAYDEAKAKYDDQN